MMRLVAALLLAASLLPIANWIPGGESDAGFGARLADWALGLALCAGIGVLAWFLVRRRVAAPAPRDSGEAVLAAATTWAVRERSAAIAIAVAAFGVYALIATVVFSGRPLLIDEIVQVLQARDLAAGDLTHTYPGPSPFFSILHEVELDGRVFGQYPIGGPAMLVPGVLLGATWVVGPLAGALCVWLFWLLVRAAEPTASARFRLATTALFAMAPFAAFMFGSHMNHATVLVWLLAAAVALTRAASDDGASPWWGLLTGVALGVAATIRPLDAGAYALPAAAWLLWRARLGGRPLAAFVLSGVGVAVPMALAFWVNARTTGHPFVFGYDLLWGAGHSLGFHETPWGAVHTPQRGVELISLYLTRLNTYLFELPFPSLLLPVAGLWTSRRSAAVDRYLLGAATMVGLGYWAYWHDGFFLGPRFVFAWMPALALWSARGVRAIVEATATRTAVRVGWAVAGVVALAYAVVTLLTFRIPVYQNGLTSMRFPADAAARAGVGGALVLVQESWGAQLIVRLWELGIPRPESDQFYRNVDTCVLDEAVQALWRAGTRGDAATAALRPLLADSARLRASDLTPDGTQRLLPGMPYSAACIARIEDDRRGYLLYAPWRLVDDGNVYARWLPGREAEILAHFPDRPVYLLRRAGSAVDAPLAWIRLSE
ncbi:MAG TPA: hypothetical protein PLY94_00290 [Gemmatimonadaceae bacterium]|nr:hypothetical protein [Gemmatimonadaceae bacterium]